MKTSITIRIIVAVALVFICNLMFSGNGTNISPDSALCLRLKGKISKNKESAGSTYTVELVDNSTIIATQVVKAGKNFVFDVQRDGWYGVRIRKSECVSKLISISTHVPELEEGYMYEVIFEMEEPISILEAGYLDSDAIDFPLALISYEKEIDNFNYSEEYTKNIRAKLLTTFIDDKKDNAPKEIASNDNDSKPEASLKNRQAIIK
jgi:hypothetical protein